MRLKAIMEAAVRPKLHAELWQRYSLPLPADDEIRRFLVREKGFNDKTVDEFIEEFKETLSFAGWLRSDKIMDGKDRKSSDKSRPVKIGDLVQWTSDGKDQFTEPREVLSLSDDDQWAFVPGTTTGFPVGELTVMSPKIENQSKSTTDGGPVPPVNPFESAPPRKTADEGWTGPTVKLDLPRKNAIEIRLKHKVTPAEFEKIKQVFALSELSFLADPGESSDDDPQK